jgi:CBS domain
MRVPVLTIEARAPLHEIADMLKGDDIKRLPVMQGDRMVGIVSRSDLVRAVATQIPKPTTGESVGGLLSLFTGMMQTEVRRENAPASALPTMAERPPVTAGSFRELVTIAEETVRADAVAAKQLAALERQRQIKAKRLEHLDKEVWAKLLDRAQAAATQRESSFELIRFPCDLCSDGGRQNRRCRNRLADDPGGRSSRGLRAVGTRASTGWVHASCTNCCIFGWHPEQYRLVSRMGRF